MRISFMPQLTDRTLTVSKADDVTADELWPGQEGE